MNYKQKLVNAKRAKDKYYKETFIDDADFRTMDMLNGIVRHCKHMVEVENSVTYTKIDNSNYVKEFIYANMSLRKLMAQFYAERKYGWRKLTTNN